MPAPTPLWRVPVTCTLPPDDRLLELTQKPNGKVEALDSGNLTGTIETDGQLIGKERLALPSMTSCTVRLFDTAFNARICHTSFLAVCYYVFSCFP